MKIVSLIKNFFRSLKKDFVKKVLAGGTILLIIGMTIKTGVYGIIASKCDNFALAFVWMILISLLIRYFLIKIYDLLKKDLFLIENIKSLRENKESNHITRRIEKLKKLGRGFLLVGLVVFDPIITALYFRPGYDKWNGLPDTKTKILFFVSDVVCSIIWGSIMQGLVTIF